MPSHLIYIHGFNSSPLSTKARLLQAHFQQRRAEARLLVPALPPSPAEAVSLLDDLITQHPDCALVGSSLGGFYATWLAERHQLSAVLINPALQPWKLLDKYTGIQHNYHTGEAWRLEPHWVDELRRFEVTQLEQPERYLLLAQTGDDTLDWQQAWHFYQECHLYKEVGGSHGFDHFDDFIPLILRFCAINL